MLQTHEPQTIISTSGNVPEKPEENSQPNDTSKAENTENQSEANPVQNDANENTDDKDITEEKDTNKDTDKVQIVNIPSAVTRPAKKIFVGGVPKTVKSDEFDEYFKKFGETKDCILMRRSGEELNRGFGFVKYADKTIADEVVDKQDHELGGKVITVNYTKFPLKNKRYFVGGLHSAVTEKEFVAHFSQYGAVEDSLLKPEKGYGFVEFTVTEENAEVLKDLPNLHHELNGKNIRVEVAKPKNDESRRDNHRVKQ
eukprot:UN22452